MELAPDEDEDDIVEAMGWDFAVCLKFNGRTFSLPQNFIEYTEGGDISSTDVSKCDTWAAAAALAKQGDCHGHQNQNHPFPHHSRI